MAPYTNIRFALGAALDSRIRFWSLEFIDINRLAPVDGLLPSQALRFEDSDFMADRLGRLWLSKENAVLPHILMPDHEPTQAGPTIVDSNALACRVDAYIGTNPKLELSQRVFYVLANAFAQHSEAGPCRQRPNSRTAALHYPPSKSWPGTMAEQRRQIPPGSWGWWNQT
jgi:hypothetical protein